MQGAMHSVVSNYGQQFEIHAVHQDMKVGQQMLGQKVGHATNNGVISSAVKESHKLGLDANEFSGVWTPTTETMIPVSAPMSKEGPIGHFTSNGNFDGGVLTNLLSIGTEKIKLYGEKNASIDRY